MYLNCIFNPTKFKTIYTLKFSCAISQTVDFDTNTNVFRTNLAVASFQVKEP